MTSDPYIFDFHTHTHLSDGDPEQSPQALCKRAVQSGIKYLSITEHDRILPLALLRALFDEFRINMVPGCEFSSIWVDDSAGEVPVHVNAPWLPSSDPTLLQIAQHNASQPYMARLQEMVYQCRKLGIGPVRESVDDTCQRIAAFFPHTDHLAKRAMAYFYEAHGYVDDRQVVYNMLAKGGPAYVDPLKFLRFVPFEELVEAIARVCLPCLNHLFYSHLTKSGNQTLLKTFKKLGGQVLEAVYTPYDMAQQAEIFGYCLEYGFLVSCGSDTHSPSRPLMQGPGRYYLLMEQRQLELYGTLNL